MMELTFDLFESLIGSTFGIEVGEEMISAELTEANKLSTPKNRMGDDPIRQQPFAVLFRLPLAVSLQQAIYPVTHSTFAQPAALFIVPVASDSDGNYFEAVFT